MQGTTPDPLASANGSQAASLVVPHRQSPQLSPPSTSAPAGATRPSSTARRFIRSREGCLTCKRRKVKCDEQRPRCSHCERLNLECKWRPQSNLTSGRRQTVGSNGSIRSPIPPSPATGSVCSPNGSGAQQPHAVDEVFDYASFMWDSGDFWQQVSPLLNTGGGGPPPVPFFQNSSNRAAIPLSMDQQTVTDGTGASQGEQSALQLMPASSGPNEDRLVDFFAQSSTPPLLAEVETQKKWVAMRQAVLEMARVSRMVRCSILAFSNLLMARKQGGWVPAVSPNHYESAVAEATASGSTSPSEYSEQRTHLLAALFFLCYVDILESRMEGAHSHLKRAHGVFQQASKSSLASVEKHFFLWFRLLDGRAVSGGGDGLFLSSDQELMVVEASPASFDGAEPDDTYKEEPGDGDIEAVLFQVLYQPGVIFYQKVQSFMGRISKIDPWHRSRGTVEDETEVMNLAAAIAADLRTLYDQRPPLMDYAVVGKLTEQHVSAHLAFAITRSFRTYLSNYYASKVHLHRVAYKSLPLTNEALDALMNIRQLARQLVNELSADDSLPVNMLWPLLMLGAEEQDNEEKAWIKTQILRMEKVASNARITAQVLEEVQARQDAAGARMDIRSVMITVFNASFAIT